ncbi:MAG: tetratricopeptide repeat protein [Candidatus Omnitrophota bacterium]
MMITQRKNRKSKIIIAVCLCMILFFQSLAWAGGDVFSKQTLQPLTIFTAEKEETAFLALVKAYLFDVEDDIRNHNIPCLIKVLTERLKLLKRVERFPGRLKKLIPSKVRHSPNKFAAEIDLAKYRIRYFNPTISGTESPDLDEEDAPQGYKILETHVGRYLTRQILSNKKTVTSNLPLKKSSRGRALFVDPEIIKPRALSEEEHNAVNEACNELVFGENKIPRLDEDNELYQFMLEDDLIEDPSIYVIEDDLLKNKLEGKGYGSLFEGFITHAGTCEGNKNLFLPRAIYRILLTLIEKRGYIHDAKNLSDFWRIHEIGHFILHDTKFDDDISESEKEKAIFLYFYRKTIEALENRDLKKAGTYLKESEEVIGTIYSVLRNEVKVRIYEAKGEYGYAFNEYISVLMESNMDSGKVIIGNPVEDKMWACSRKLSKNRFQKHMQEKLDFLQKKGKYAEFKQDPSEAYEEVKYFGIIPYCLKYIRERIFFGELLSSFEFKLIDVLIDLEKKGELINPCSGQFDKNVSARLYFLAGEVYYYKKDFAKAVEYLERSKELDPGNINAEILCAISRAEKEQTIEAVESALSFLCEIEGDSDFEGKIEGMKNYLIILKMAVEETEKRKKEVEILYNKTYAKALVFFNEGYYAQCGELIINAKDEAQEPLSEDLKNLREEAKKLSKLKQKAEANLCQNDHEKTKELAEEIVRHNPLDEVFFFKLQQIPFLAKQAKSITKETEFLKKHKAEAESFMRTARGQKKAGRIERARNNFQKAIDCVNTALDYKDSVSSHTNEIKKMRDELIKLKENALAITEEIKGWADRVEIQRQKKEEVVFLDIIKKKNVVEEIPEEEPIAEHPEEKRKVMLPKSVVHKLGKIKRKNPQQYKKVIEELTVLPDEDIKNLCKVKGHGPNEWRERGGEFRIILDLDHEGYMFVRFIEHRDERTYKKVIANPKNAKISKDDILLEAYLTESEQNKSGVVKTADSLILDEGFQINPGFIDESKRNRDIEGIIQNMEFVAPRLVQALMNAAEKDKTGKVVLLVDEELNGLCSEKAEREMKRLIGFLENIKNNNDELKMFLEDLEIRSGRGKELLKKTGKIKPENVILITKKTSVDQGYFSSLENKAIIAEIDDSTPFSKRIYLPIVEVALFAMGKYLNWDQAMLKEHYANIPNAVKINDLNIDENDRLFNPRMKNFVIRIIPDAAKFSSEELVEIIQRLKHILSKA